MCRMCSHPLQRFCFSVPRLLVPAMVLLIVSACTTVPPLAGQVDPELLAYSDQRRMERQERAQVPLEERIALIEADLERTLVPVGEGALAPRFLSHAGLPGPLHLEHNAAVLSALAAKYAVTGDEGAKALAQDLVRGIMALDALSGELDGFVPLEADARTFEVSERTTHANAYTQLLFAYVVADAFIGPNEEVQQHVSLIYRRFAEDGFALRQPDGTRLGKANVGGPLLLVNARRAFDRRLLDRAAIHLGDEETRELARHRRWAGPLLGPAHVRFFALEIPTPSSSWLNLQAMTGLTLLDQPQRSRATRLARRYRKDDNPFFRILAAMNSADEDLAAIRRRLEEFPYPVTSSGIINSHRDDVALAGRNFIKFHATPESREPLPLYEVRSDLFLWKRRLREVDSMPQARPLTLLGHDLYQAYWFLRILEER